MQVILISNNFNIYLKRYFEIFVTNEMKINYSKQLKIKSGNLTMIKFQILLKENSSIENL